MTIIQTIITIIGAALAVAGADLLVARWKSKQQDVHVWQIQHKFNLADSLLRLRDQGYTIKIISIIESKLDERTGCRVTTQAIIITEK